MLSGPFDDQILQALIDEALSRGGRDNITGVVVDVGETSDGLNAVRTSEELPITRGPVR